MAVLLGLDSVSVNYPTKTVLDSVSLGVNTGDRIGIVGLNGEGKSTLLSLFAQRIDADSGRVLQTNSTHVDLLAQRDNLDDDASIEQVLFGGRPTFTWAQDPKNRDIIAHLVGDLDLSQQIKTLSGGQRRRVDLARILMGDADVILLDEPTNHLDMQTIHWLAQHVKTRWKKGSGALIVVSHDRWFLDEVCETMWEVFQGKVSPFEGGYSAYILQRVEREAQAIKAEQKRQNAARKELAWLSRGARARSTKPKFHVKAAQELIAQDPPIRQTLELKKTALSRLGKQVIDFKDVTFAYPGKEPCLREMTWSIGPGDRIGILGANGAGKTSLLKLITSDLVPRSGSVRCGKTVVMRTLTQRLDELAPYLNDRVKDVLSAYKTHLIMDGKEYSSTQLLEMLGFERGSLMTYVRDLSGGQQRRLQLMITLFDKPNVLLLDEPGNDLDTDMLGVMEDLLDSWAGTLILITHDRHLMERVTDDQYLLEDGTLTHMVRGVDQYLEHVSQTSARAVTTLPHASLQEGSRLSAHASSNTPKKSSGKATYELSKKCASLERKIQTAQGLVDDKKAALTLVDPTDFEGLVAAQEEINQAQEALEALEIEWLELTEELEELK